MTDPLREAAQAVVDRWDTPLWKDAPATGEFINRLRAVLALPAPEPVAWQPIKTAPMRGSLLLCDAEGAITVGFWGKHNHVPLYGWLRVMELGDEEVEGFDPTHWMPLPAQPMGHPQGEKT